MQVEDSVESTCLEEADQCREGGKCLRTDRYKVVCWTDDIGEFYDLAEDPMERRNLWADPDCADLVRDHERMLLAKLLKSEKPILLRSAPAGG